MFAVAVENDGSQPLRPHPTLVPVPGALQVVIEREPESLTLILRGELALDSAPLLERAMSEAEDSSAGRVVIIDLRKLEFIDSAGLHLLVDARRRLQARGSELVLRRGPRAVQRLFELTGADAQFCFE